MNKNKLNSINVFPFSRQMSTVDQSSKSQIMTALKRLSDAVASNKKLIAQNNFDGGKLGNRKQIVESIDSMTTTVLQIGSKFEKSVIVQKKGASRPPTPKQKLISKLANLEEDQLSSILHQFSESNQVTIKDDFSSLIVTKDTISPESTTKPD